MTDRLADWVALVDRRYPERDAASWDASGLQVGAPDDPVERVLVCLDVTDATLDEAHEEGAQLLLAHHPLLFRPLERLTPATAGGRLVLRAAREGLAVLAAHTNVDAAVPGTTDPIARLLQLTGLRPLAPLRSESRPSSRVKLVTFLPEDALEPVIAALAGAGAGRIGAYQECAYSAPGVGRFTAGPGTAPAVGTPGETSEVAERRLEMVLDRTDLPAAVAALVAAHPYEEVAWDAYPLLDADPRPGGDGRPKGIGLVGELPAPRSLAAIARLLTEGLPSPHLRLAGEPEREIRTVAACGGAGEGHIGDALAAGADVYVTGDLRHHPTLDARTMGMALIDAGHYRSEAAALPDLTRALAADAARDGLSASLVASAVVTEPWVELDPRGAEGGTIG